MIETILGLSAAVVAAVEFFKTALLKMAWFQGLDEQSQSLILQLLAFVFGVVAAVAGSVNALASLPAFASTPEWLGIVITGLVAGTGSSGIHAIISLIGIKAGVTAEKRAAAPKAQSAGEITRVTYSPFL